MKAEWKVGRYNSSSLTLSGGLTVLVQWKTVSKFAPEDEHGYEVLFERNRLKSTFRSMEEGQRAGELLAQKHLLLSLEKLGWVVDDSGKSLRKGE